VALEGGEYRLTAEAAGFPVITKTILISGEIDQTEGEPFGRVTGFPIRSYVTASFTYHVRRGMSR